MFNQSSPRKRQKLIHHRLVAGVDSSTQSVKVQIRDAETGILVREGKAAHPSGTSVHPSHWVSALQEALKLAGGISDCEAISIGGQQHGSVFLDSKGEIIREALLWNDTRSAKDAEDLNKEIGKKEVVSKVGTSLVASLTVTKVRWLASHEPENASKLAAIALPHDFLSWKLLGKNDLSLLFTDRSDASGTGYFNSSEDKYCRDILATALKCSKEKANNIILPKILKPNEFGGVCNNPSLFGESSAKIGPGAGDNAGAALGLQAKEGDVIISIGTSGTAFSVSKTATHDIGGFVAGFASASGTFLPLVCTLNAARVLDAVAKLLGVDHDELSRLALLAPPGSHGLTLLPYFEGERTPNRPTAKGILSGITLESASREDLARAAYEGILCGLADAVDFLVKQGVEVKRILLIGGGSRSEVVPIIASSILDREVQMPPSGEYVCIGACRQAAWCLLGSKEAPIWDLGEVKKIRTPYEPSIRERYAALRDGKKSE